MTVHGSYHMYCVVTPVRKAASVARKLMMYSFKGNKLCKIVACSFSLPEQIAIEFIRASYNYIIMTVKFCTTGKEVRAITHPLTLFMTACSISFSS